MDCVLLAEPIADSGHQLVHFGNNISRFAKNVPEFQSTARMRLRVTDESDHLVAAPSTDGALIKIW